MLSGLGLNQIGSTVHLSSEPRLKNFKTKSFFIIMEWFQSSFLKRLFCRSFNLTIDEILGTTKNIVSLPQKWVISP